MGAKRQKDRAEFRFVSALSLSSRRRRKRWACDACDRVSSRASGAQLVRLGVSVSRGRLKLVAVAEIEDWLRRGSSATRGLGSGIAWAAGQLTETQRSRGMKGPAEADPPCVESGLMPGRLRWSC